MFIISHTNLKLDNKNEIGVLRDSIIGIIGIAIRMTIFILGGANAMDKATLDASINFELYKIFYYSARALNFSKAAIELHVTQSAVSQAIKSLETQLGVALFSRQGRHVKLTYEGEILYQHIEKAFNFIKSAENSIRSIKSLDEGTVFIGASDTITRYFLISKIKAFHALYPKVKIAINNRPSPRSVALLQNGEIDIAVINVNPTVEYDGLDMLPIAEIENAFICAASRTDLTEMPQSLETISEHPLVCLEQKSTTRTVLETYYKAHGVPLKPAFEFGSLEVILESVKSDMGIGFVSRNIALTALEAGSVKEIEVNEQVPSITVGVLTNKSKPLSIAAQKFYELLQ